jgi:Ca-activated chloride channel family protein
MTLPTTDTIRLGRLVEVTGGASPLPLEKTTVTGQILGPLAVISVVQRFSNPLDQPAELEYLFPLPHEAAITGFELRVGARRVQSSIQELEEARRQFDEAREAGSRAGLLEQHRPNLFSIRLTNVQPGEVIEAQVRYQERVRFDDGSYQFVFPMGITPRYGSPEHPQEQRGVNAPIAAAGEKIGPVEIELAVDSGFATADPVSPSHPLTVTRLDERRFSIRLGGPTIPDHDFVMRCAALPEQAPAGAVLAAWRSVEKDGGTFLATLVPPPLGEEMADPAPREFVFVLDRSGSMSGEPIAQARNALRACLRALNPGDTFRILLFDDQLEWYRPQASSVTQAEIDAADRYLDGVDGRGGTEIIPALEEALKAQDSSGRARFIVFLTDGAVSAEERALDQLRKQVGRARLFTFGIGPSVNRALLQQMARIGRGTAEFLQLEEDIEGAIIRFQDRVAFPVLSDLVLQVSGGRAWDVYPVTLPDLYVGQPLEILGRLKAEPGKAVSLTVAGRVGQKDITLQAELPAGAGEEPALSRLWARARVDDLIEQVSSGGRAAHKTREEVIGLALEYNLVTPFTAFIAVDPQAPKKLGKPVPLQVAQPLPQGLDISGFMGGNGPLRQAMSAPPGSTGAAAPLPSMPMPSMSSRKLMAAPPPPPAAAKPSGKTFAESGPPALFYQDKDDGDLENMPAPGRADLPPQDLEGLLRWLARSQRVDGSWEKDLEWTLAALLVFLRAGHTTRAGNFRVQVRRAAAWVIQANAAENLALVRAIVLGELARQDALVPFVTAAQEARALALAGSAPAATPEGAGLARILAGQTAVSPAPGTDESALRLAALGGGARPKNMPAPGTALGVLWAACLKPA